MGQEDEQAVRPQAFAGFIVERTTVILGREGRVERIFPKMKLHGLVHEVEDEVRRLA